jgi:Leucine-rich repeat (LRR) protein
LTSLPEALCDLNQLDCIYLEDNLMTSSGFPTRFGEIISLKGLCLHRNKLTELPISICSLTNLQELYIDGNQISALPDEIGYLRELTEIVFMQRGIN